MKIIQLDGPGLACTKALAELKDLLESNPNYILYIRGDANVNKNNNVRNTIFKNFMSSMKILSIPIDHKTYHHFMGGGLFDSNIDVILQTKNRFSTERIQRIFCKQEYPIIESHHDLILSFILLPELPVQPPAARPQAPAIQNKRTKVVWGDEELIRNYQNILSDKISEKMA